MLLFLFFFFKYSEIGFPSLYVFIGLATPDYEFLWSRNKVSFIFHIQHLVNDLPCSRSEIHIHPEKEQRIEREKKGRKLRGEILGRNLQERMKEEEMKQLNQLPIYLLMLPKISLTRNSFCEKKTFLLA